MEIKLNQFQTDPRPTWTSSLAGQVHLFYCSAGRTSDPIKEIYGLKLTIPSRKLIKSKICEKVLCPLHIFYTIMEPFRSFLLTGNGLPVLLQIK